MSGETTPKTFEKGRVIVRAADVLVLTVPYTMTREQKQGYLEWFQRSIAGTSLGDCRVILLDGGAQVDVYRGENIEPMT